MNAFNFDRLRKIDAVRFCLTLALKYAFRLTTGLACLLWSGAIVLRAGTHYVCPYNEGQANPYDNWGTAGTNIIDVVNAAMTNAESRTVWVSNGVYILTNQINVTNALTLRSIEGHGPDDTIINGNYSAYTNRCIVISNKAAFVSGLTFSNGAIVTGAGSTNGGGGVRMYGGVLSNCTVCNNSVFAGSDTDGGGGILIRGDGCSSTVEACRVIGNLMTNLSPSGKGEGGGICVYADALIKNTLISNNLLATASGANNNGGGIKVVGYNIRILSCMICNNRAPNTFAGGVAMASWGGVGEFMGNCTVTVNQANNAAGVYMNDGVISNCVISYNSSLGMYINPSNPWEKCRLLNSTIIGNSNGTALQMNNNTTASLTSVVANCVIEGNNGDWAVNALGINNFFSNCVFRNNQKGAVYAYNGTFRNCLFTGNTNSGGSGAGIRIADNAGTVLVSSCTIVSNKMPSTAFTGAGILITATNATILISSCVISSNLVEGASGKEDIYDTRAPTNFGALQYSCIGSNPGFTGAGIIVTNPSFKNFTAGDYRLNPNSPCINTGSNETWMMNSLDLDGRMRIRYGTVDMGAYEGIYDGTFYNVQ